MGRVHAMRTIPQGLLIGSVYRAGTCLQRNCFKEPVVTASKSLYYKGGSRFQLVNRLSIAQRFRMAFADGGYWWR